MNTGYFVYKGNEIFYRQEGDGIPLVLLHGYLESGEIWESFVPLLRDKFRIICPDLPGHGLSGILGDIHTMDFMAECVKALLNSLSINSCVLAGHSMGGYVTLAFADLFPEHLKAFILIHSTPFADSSEKRNNRDREADLIRQGKKEMIVNTNIPKAFANDNLVSLKAEIENAKTIAINTSDDGIISLLMGMKERPDRTHIIAGTDMPILWILGRKDNYIVYNQVSEKIQKWPHVKILLLSDSGHMGFIEEPDKTASCIKDFILSLQYH